MTTYDTLSPWYDWLAASERPHMQAGAAMLALRPDETVLEIGCGTGHGAVALRHSGASVLALDLSAGMLSRARRRVSAGLIQGSGLCLPLRSASVDAVFMSFTLELFASPAHVLAECRRVLRDDGRLGVVSLQRGTTWPVRVYDWAHRRWPVWIDCRPIAVREVVEAAGFVVQDSAESSLWGLPVVSLVGAATSAQP